MAHEQRCLRPIHVQHIHHTHFSQSLDTRHRYDTTLKCPIFLESIELISNEINFQIGCYQETHGVVNNVMYNRKENKVFGRRRDLTSEWFGQNPEIKPIWLVNDLAGEGRRSAASWIGSEVVFDGHFYPNISYDHDRNFTDLADYFIRQFASKNDDDRINFAAMYYDEPGNKNQKISRFCVLETKSTFVIIKKDYTGHRHGPDSIAMAEKLTQVDGYLGYVIEQLTKFNLIDKLNLIVLSDHGMAPIVNSSTAKIILSDRIYDWPKYYKCFGAKTLVNIFVDNGK